MENIINETKKVEESYIAPIIKHDKPNIHDKFLVIEDETYDNPNYTSGLCLMDLMEGRKDVIKTIEQYTSDFELDLSIIPEEVYQIPVLYGSIPMYFDKLKSVFPEIKILTIIGNANTINECSMIIKLSDGIYLATLNSVTGNFKSKLPSVLTDLSSLLIRRHTLLVSEKFKTDKVKLTQIHHALKQTSKKFYIPTRKATSFSISLVMDGMGGPTIYNKTINFDKDKYPLTMVYDSIDQKFHDQLLESIEKETSGIIVFNGEPGTGKSMYIRKLIKDYQSKDIYGDRKLFLYLPTKLAERLSDPTMLTLLQQTAMDYSNGIVVIIEDAEGIIMHQEGGERLDTTSIILNMSDGILNDLVNIQFLLTYNTETHNIDEALLRNGRLMAKKKFGKITAEQATRLSAELGLDIEYSEPTIIADIFAEIRADVNDVLIDNE